MFNLMFTTKRHLEYAFRCKGAWSQYRGGAGAVSPLPLWVNRVHVSLDTTEGHEKKWHPQRYSSLLGCRVSVSASNQREKKGKTQSNLLFWLPPLSSLFVWVLSGQRGAACRLVRSIFEAPLYCTNCVLVCGRVWACLNSVEFSHRSIPGSFDACGPAIFPLFFLWHTHTNRKPGVAYSAVTGGKRVQTVHLSGGVKNRHRVSLNQLIKQSGSPLFSGCSNKNCAINVRWNPWSHLRGSHKHTYRCPEI